MGCFCPSLRLPLKNSGMPLKVTSPVRRKDERRGGSSWHYRNNSGTLKEWGPSGRPAHMALLPGSAFMLPVGWPGLQPCIGTLLSSRLSFTGLALLSSLCRQLLIQAHYVLMTISASFVTYFPFWNLCPSGVSLFSLRQPQGTLSFPHEIGK